MATYGFTSVSVTLIGPGGILQVGAGTANPAVSLGYGAGVGEEGISVEYTEDRGALTIGADSTPMHSLKNNKSGTAIVRLQKTSAMNAVLMDMYNYQALTAANWGQNVFTVTDTNLGDLVTGESVAFRKATSLVYAEVANMNEWAFLIGILDMSLGKVAA
jgi:hypothetical protein